MYKNVACLPIVVNKMFTSSILLNEIKNHEYSKGCIVTNGIKTEWLRAEICLFYNEKNLEIPTNWNLSANQVLEQSDEIKKESQELYSYIKENLKISPSYISIQKTKGSMPDHYDIPPGQYESVKNRNFYEPCLVKILLNPKKSVNKLYFVNNSIKTFFSIAHINVTSNVYAWNNTCVKHGIDDTTLDSDRFIINIYGDYNNTKYKQLLEKSYKQNKLNAIVF